MLFVKNSVRKGASTSFVGGGVKSYLSVVWPMPFLVDVKSAPLRPCLFLAVQPSDLVSWAYQASFLMKTGIFALKETYKPGRYRGDKAIVSSVSSIKAFADRQMSADIRGENLPSNGIGMKLA